MNLVDSAMNDVLYYVAKNNPTIWLDLLPVNASLQKIALRCFSEANSEIIKTLPMISFERHESAHIIFKKLIDQLNDEDEDVNNKWLSKNKTENLFRWGCVNYPEWIKNIVERIERDTEIAFNTFVTKIVEHVEFIIPKKISPRAAWKDFLQNNDKVKNLTKLRLCECNLKFLPPEISFLTQLQELDLNTNNLTKLPKEIGSLVDLKYIYLNSNKMTDLPVDFIHLQKLIFINLNFNNLSKIPTIISSLPNLVHLQMTNNNLTIIPSNSFHSKSKLEYVNFSFNSLSKGLEGIFSLKKITQLHLNSINLKEIPTEFENLKELKTLSLGTNEITTIDEKLISSLSNLETLFLCTNPLTNDTELKLAKFNILPLSIETDATIIHNE